VGGVKGESRLMMDKEAGAKTRHVAVVVRRFKTLVHWSASAIAQYRWKHAEDVMWCVYCMFTRYLCYNPWEIQLI
jgi:hypothetical protein